jgi:hypothetical protein
VRGFRASLSPLVYHHSPASKAYRPGPLSNHIGHSPARRRPCLDPKCKAERRTVPRRLGLTWDSSSRNGSGISVLSRISTSVRAHQTLEIGGRESETAGRGDRGVSSTFLRARADFLSGFSRTTARQEHAFGPIAGADGDCSEGRHEAAM